MKNKKIIAGMLSLALFSSLAVSVAYAKEENKPAEKPQKIMSVKEEKQREETKSRYEMSVKTLEGLLSKTESKIEQMQASSTVSSTTSALLEEAKTKVEAAKNELVVLQELLEQKVSTSTDFSQELLSQIKEQGKKVEIAMKEAREAINEVSKSMKEARRSLFGLLKEKFWGERKNATSTYATSTKFSTSTARWTREILWNWGWFNPFHWFRK